LETKTIPNKAAYAMIFVVIVFTTLLYGAVHYAVLAATYVGIVVMLAFIASDWLMNGAIRVSREPIQLILFLTGVYGLFQVIPFGTPGEIAGVTGISRTISLDPFATQVSAVHFLFLGVYFSIVLIIIDSASRLRKFAIFIAVLGFAYAFFAILQSILSPTKIYGLLERPYAQPFGSFISRNNFAAWMELAIAVPMGMLFSGTIERDKRLLYGTAVALMGVSLIVSGSRGGLVVLLLEIGLLFLLTYSFKSRSQAWIRVLMIPGLLLAIVAGTVFVGGETSFTRLGQEEAEPVNSVSRLQMWGVTLKMIGDNMPFGVGLGAFGVAYTRYDVASGLERVEQAHNDFLQVISDAGIVGAILGLAFLVLLFRLARRALASKNAFRRGIAAGCLTGIFGALVHSIFDFGLHTTSIAILFLTLLGVLAASASAYEDDIVLEEDARARRRKRKSAA
jgi:O-antigen ligase